jgi:hypothetical protein
MSWSGAGEIEIPAENVKQYARRYLQGPNRYVNYIHDKLPVRLSEAQRRLARAVAEHQRVLVIGANGPGKSYGAACIAQAFLHSYRPSTVLATSGTYGKLKRTLCRPIEALQHHDDLAHPLPGEYKHSPPRIDTGDPEWFFEAARPKDAGELEGTHNECLLAITEEADKPAVDADVIESMDSCLTDRQDRHLVIANPPQDGANVVADLMGSDAWHTVRLATWDSRNVRVDAGEHDGPRIPGLLGLTEVEQSWEAWNNEAWPGLEKARTAHKRRDDLDERWYRRRAGVMPPDGAETWRPFYPRDVEAAYADTSGVTVRDARYQNSPLGSGLDVARSGDRTVLITAYPGGFKVRNEWSGTDYPQQEADVMEILNGGEYHPLAVDAAGEGSGLADYLADRWPEVYRFRSGGEPPTDASNPRVETEYGASNYRSQRAEAMAALGDYLETTGEGAVASQQLRTELISAARTAEFDERTLASRGDEGAQVVEINDKAAVAEHLGRSPDYLDAAMQAAWAARCTPDTMTAEDAVILG